MAWDPTQYLAFAGERRWTTLDLLARIKQETLRIIVDLGSGQGNVTGVVSARWAGVEIIRRRRETETPAGARKDDPQTTWVEADIIGKNTVLGQGVIIKAGAKIGDNSSIGKDSVIFENAVVGCFAAPTSFTPVCAGAAIGATLEAL